MTKSKRDEALDFDELDKLSGTVKYQIDLIPIIAMRRFGMRKPEQLLQEIWDAAK